MVRIFWCMLSERELTGVIIRCIKLREDTVSLLRRWKCSVTTNHGSLKIFEVCWNEEMVAFWKSWMEFSEREGLRIQGFHSKNTFWEQEWAKILNRQCKACMGGTPSPSWSGKGNKTKHEHDMQSWICSQHKQPAVEGMMSQKHC